MAVDLILRRLLREERDGMWEFARTRGLGAWSREDFHRHCDAGLIGGVIAERGRRLAGLLLYSIHAEEPAVTVVTLGVMPDLRRRGIGSLLLAELRRRLQGAGPVRIDAVVDERDLEAQLFLRVNGFRAARILPAAFAGGADDGYCFEYHMPPPRPARPARRPRRHDPSIE